MSSLTWYHVVHVAGKRHPQTFVDQSLSSQKKENDDERTDLPPARWMCSINREPRGNVPRAKIHHSYN